MKAFGTIFSKRLEAFSHGVFVIITTIMVLEIKMPKGQDLPVLRPILPVLLSYIFSLISVQIIETIFITLSISLPQSMEGFYGQVPICYFGFHFL